MTTLIEWGYRQGSVVTLADNERDAATRVEILASLGHVAEVVHRRVILEEGVDMVSEFRQNWLDGGPDVPWRTVYRALKGNAVVGEYATPEDAWIALGARAHLSPASTTGSVVVPESFRDGEAVVGPSSTLSVVAQDVLAEEQAGRPL